MKKSLILLFFINFNIQASFNLRVNWEMPKVADRKKDIKKPINSCNSQVDVVYLRDLTDHIYDELKYAFSKSDQFSINENFSDYISKLRLTNNDTREIVLSLEQLVSIFSFIKSMHLENKKYFLEYEEVEKLLKTACKNCAISTKSADTIMSCLSAAYVNLID